MDKELFTCKFVSNASKFVIFIIKIQKDWFLIQII